MLKTWKLRLCSAALVSFIAAVGCYDFGAARQKCEDDKRCEGPPDPVCMPDTSRPDEPGDFDDTDCDGIDGIATAGLYVDPVNGQNGTPGTRERPLKTIREALTLLRSNPSSGITSLYLARGTYDEDGLVLNSPVSLYGAYGGTTEDWKRKREYSSHVDGGTIGFVIQGIPEDAGVVLDHLIVTAANATTSGAPSIALQIIDSHNVRLRDSTFSAGQGAPGVSGTSGAQGTDGGVGGWGGSTATTASGTRGDPGLSTCGTIDYSGGA
jgi:hypothetical protein